MSHPPFWLSKHYFYPIGNTGAVSLTQDLSPEQTTADILLLGCGDARNILFTLYSDLTVGQVPRNLDVTCCDHEPAVLARNILLFSLLDQNENMDRVWDIFYHFKIDDRALKIITRQSETLYELAESVETWRNSRFGAFVKMVDTRTLAELRRHWQSYADFPRLPSDRKNRILKAQLELSKSVKDMGGVSPSRSAGMLWPQAVTPVSNLFRKYWETGTTFTLASDIKSASNINPTFVYSSSGEGFDPHYGTFPSGFHLISAFAPIKSDPAGPAPNTGSAAINASKQQFSAWCKAFREARKAESIIIRCFVGDALSFCRALNQFKTTGNPSTDVFVSAYRAAQIHFNNSAGEPTPTDFDVIDTSNLTDHLGLFNLLLATHVLLKRAPQSQAVLYTETLLPFGRDATKSFLERILTDVPTIAMLFGIAPRPYVSGFTTHSNVHEVISSKVGDVTQYHERVVWSDPSGGDKLLPVNEPRVASFEAESLARILYGIYDNMFSNEKMSTMMSTLSMALRPNTLNDLGRVHFHRETVALLFQTVQSRVHLHDGDWEEVVQRFFNLCISSGARMIETNCTQDLSLQIHRYGVYTDDPFKPNWAAHPEFRFSPRSTLFSNFSNLPPVFCVVLTVPRRRLDVFNGKPEKIGSPTFQAGVWVPGSHDNFFASINLAWGKCITPPNSEQMVIEEDPDGQRGRSDLVVSFWANTRLLEIANTHVSLRLKSTPQSTVFVSKLGMNLDVFGASIMDKKHVQVLTYQPALAGEPSRTVPGPANKTISSHSEHLCQAIVSNPRSQHVDSLSIRFNVKSEEGRKALGGGAQVSATQVSACTMELKIGDFSHLLSYPYPVNGKTNKLRIARKSFYVEVLVSVSAPNDYSGYFLNPFPIINPDAYTAWNLHNIRLDRLPTLDVKKPSEVGWLNGLTAMQMSLREKAIRHGDAVQKHAAINALVNAKDSIHAITMNVSGVQGHQTRTIGLCEKTQGGIYVILLVGGIRIDAASSTIVLDTAVVPLSNERMPALGPGIRQIMNAAPLVQNLTTGQEVAAWKRLIPAFVERCRDWSHLPTCEYKAQGRIPLSTVIDENPICTCGQGIGFTGPEWKVPEWRDLLPFATRAAICPIFSVLYIEPMGSDWKEHSGAVGNKSAEVCWACGGPGKPSLLKCSRCKQASYCSATCQRQDWAAHKGICKAK